MRVQSWNEWDPLKSVIVGSAKNARVPAWDLSLAAINYADQLPRPEIPSGRYPDRVIEETQEDLQRLVDELEALGVVVFRPEECETDKVFSDGNWSSEGYYSYCPRDSVLIHGPNIIEAPMPIRARYFESRIFRHIFSRADEEARWVAAPRPMLGDESYQTEGIDRDTLTLRNYEPCFDAANILRCGRDLFYLVSNSGNEAGAKWLRSFLGPEYRIHELKNIYSYMHLDSTLCFLRPGLVLLNPSRMNEENLPEPLRSWDKIWCADPVDIGYAEGYCHASEWIGMNLLMVRPDLAIVEANQRPLIRQLEKSGIDVLPLPIRHARTLGGGFHCVTLDVEREGQMEDYF